MGTFSKSPASVRLAVVSATRQASGNLRWSTGDVPVGSDPGRTTAVTRSPARTPLSDHPTAGREAASAVSWTVASGATAVAAPAANVAQRLRREERPGTDETVRGMTSSLSVRFRTQER